MRKWFKIYLTDDLSQKPLSENTMKHRIKIMCLLLCFSITTTVLNGAQNKPKDLPQNHQKWIDLFRIRALGCAILFKPVFGNLNGDDQLIVFPGIPVDLVQDKGHGG